MGQILTFTTTKVKPHWICAKTHKLPTWLNNLRGILQGNPAFSMSSSYSFAHHKSVYQFFFFHFISIAFLLSSLYLLPHQHSFFLRLLSLFSFLSLSFPLPSYNPTFFLPFGAPSPPTTPSHHPLLPLPPFYLTSFSNPFPSSYPLTHPPLSFPGPYISFASLLPIIPYSLSKLLPRGFNCRNNLLRYSFIFLSGEQLCRVRPHSLNLDHSLCVQNRGLRLRLHLLAHLNVPQYLSQGQLQGHQR